MRHLIILSLFNLALIVAGYSQTPTTIYDIQFVDVNGGSDVSPLNNQLVRVSGVVTASGESDDLGAVFIQQEGLNEWAGIQLMSSSMLATLKVGDVVDVIGTVTENSGRTTISFITEVDVTGTSSVVPPVLDPNIFTNYSLTDNEKYEGMLVILSVQPNLMSVGEKNADGTNNFGEWRVGSDPLSPTEGCRILTGRQTSSTQSSLNVSYVNDSEWETTNGMMNVPVIEINEGDEFLAIAGIMDYAFGNFKLLPRNNDDVVLDDILAVNGELSGLKNIQLWPNPTVEHAVLAFHLEEATALSINLLDIQGRLAHRLIAPTSMTAGRHRMTMTIDPAWSPGTYILVIHSENGNTSLLLEKY